MITLRQAQALVLGLALMLSTSACRDHDVLSSAQVPVIAPPVSRPLPTPSANLGTTQIAYANWHRDISQATSVLQLPALPQVNSPELKQELDEIYTLQTRLNAQIRERVLFWDAGGVLRWNEIARQLVAKTSTPPPKAARVYAALSIAHYFTLQAVHEWQTHLARQSPAELDTRIRVIGKSPQRSCPSEEAALAAAAQAVLQYLFPGEAYAIGQSALEHKESQVWAGINVRSDLAAGDAIGRAIALKVIERARKDGTDEASAAWTASLPEFSGAWRSVINKPPLLPLWGRVQPWFMTSNAQFRAPEHPPIESLAFTEALDELRQQSRTRTPEQLRIATYWADGAGTSTPPGHWNQIAMEAIAQSPQKIDSLQAAKILALMNMAMMDAGIAVWETKYHYWLERPVMADAQIDMVVNLPNFPAYTSGHSGFSGAASEVLAYFLPAQADSFRAMAEEASISRVYGGIHYRFDCTEGLVQGRKVAALAIAADQSN